MRTLELAAVPYGSLLQMLLGNVCGCFVAIICAPRTTLGVRLLANALESTLGYRVRTLAMVSLYSQGRRRSKPVAKFDAKLLQGTACRLYTSASCLLTICLGCVCKHCKLITGAATRPRLQQVPSTCAMHVWYS